MRAARPSSRNSTSHEARLFVFCIRFEVGDHFASLFLGGASLAGHICRALFQMGAGVEDSLVQALLKFARRSSVGIRQVNAVAVEIEVFHALGFLPAHRMRPGKIFPRRAGARGGSAS